MDWRQLWEIMSAPDNVPIVGLIPLLIFYIYLAWKQAKANDNLVAELEANPAMAKTHHRKTWPFRRGWQISAAVAAAFGAILAFRDLLSRRGGRV